MLQLTPAENRDYLEGGAQEAINLTQLDPTVPEAQSWAISIWSRYYPNQTDVTYAHLVYITNNKKYHLNISASHVSLAQQQLHQASEVHC